MEPYVNNQPFNPPAIIEEDQLNGLVNAAGIEGTQDILTAFWNSTESLMAALKSEITAKDYDLASKTAHAIKGSAANVGAKRLAAVAHRIEECCKIDDMPGAIECLERAEQAYTDTRSAFDAHLAAA